MIRSDCAAGHNVNLNRYAHDRCLHEESMAHKQMAENGKQNIKYSSYYRSENRFAQI